MSHFQAAAFERHESPFHTLELSLVSEESDGEGDGACGVRDLPRFANLRSLRMYQPEFGSSPHLTELLRRNLPTLSEVAFFCHCGRRFDAALMFVRQSVGAMFDGFDGGARSGSASRSFPATCCPVPR